MWPIVVSFIFLMLQSFQSDRIVLFLMEVFPYNFLLSRSTVPLKLHFSRGGLTVSLREQLDIKFNLQHALAITPPLSRFSLLCYRYPPFFVVVYYKHLDNRFIIEWRVGKKVLCIMYKCRLFNVPQSSAFPGWTHNSPFLYFFQKYHTFAAVLAESEVFKSLLVNHIESYSTWADVIRILVSGCYCFRVCLSSVWWVTAPADSSLDRLDLLKDMNHSTTKFSIYFTPPDQITARNYLEIVSPRIVLK